MTYIYHIILTLLHKLFCCKESGCLVFPDTSTDYSKTSKHISKLIKQNVPFMVSRFGAVEINALYNYKGVSSVKHNILKYIYGKEPQWWWNRGVLRCMTNNAGFFPNDSENICKFSKLMLEDISLIDVLISWQPKELYFQDILKNHYTVNYVTIDPFFAEEPWSYNLKGKTVLVIHPFSEEIEYQYKNNRTKIFKDSRILPEFNLITYKSVQSIGGNSSYSSWFEALSKMENDISSIDFDIALLGCGAYGMPLAAYIKRLGKQSIHIGGSLQLLFGIKGARWENPMYGYDIHHTKNKYPELFNEFWIRPYNASGVLNMDRVDNGCYW